VDPCRLADGPRFPAWGTPGPHDPVSLIPPPFLTHAQFSSWPPFFCPSQRLLAADFFWARDSSGARSALTAGPPFSFSAILWRILFPLSTTSVMLPRSPVPPVCVLFFFFGSRRTPPPPGPLEVFSHFDFFLPPTGTTSALVIFYEQFFRFPCPGWLSRHRRDPPFISLATFLSAVRGRPQPSEATPLPRPFVLGTLFLFFRQGIPLFFNPSISPFIFFFC